jgi:hypothetical protein
VETGRGQAQRAITIRDRKGHHRARAL